MFTRQRPQPALPQSPEELAKRTPQLSIHDLSYSELKTFHEHEIGLTLDDLKPEKPKHQHPDDAVPQWSGRGKPPVWLQELLSQGRQLEEFAIGAASAAQ